MQLNKYFYFFIKISYIKIFAFINNFNIQKFKI